MVLPRAVIFFIRDRVLSLTGQHVVTDSVVIGGYTMETFATFLPTGSKMDITQVYFFYVPSPKVNAHVPLRADYLLV